MSILQALSTIPFFVNINQGIDRTLALLEVKEKTAALKGQPILVDCVSLMLRSLNVLENELTAIATDTTAIATATATDTTATDTTATDTAIAAATAIDDDFQLVTFEEMTDYLFFQQSWKMIKDPSLAMKGQGYLSDRIDSAVWSFNKVLPIYYDKENKMIIVKSGLSFYGCIASYSSIDELKWQFAHNLLHDLKHCTAAATDTAIAAATDTAIAAATDTAIAAATDTAIAAATDTAIAAATDTAIAAATDTAIAAATDTAIAAATDTAIAAATDTAIATESTTAIATESTTAIATESTTAIAAATIKTETEANRALSKFQKLWYLQQIDYPEIEQLKGIASINAAITSVSSFMAAYKAVKNHGIPEKDPNKKSAKSDKQTVNKLELKEQSTVQVVKVIPSTKIEIADTTVNAPESDPIALPSTIKVNGVVEIKKP